MLLAMQKIYVWSMLAGVTLVHACGGAKFAGPGSKDSATSKSQTTEQPQDVAGGLGLTCDSSENTQNSNNYDFNCYLKDKDGQTFGGRPDIKVEVIVKILDQVVNTESQLGASAGNFKFTVGKSDAENVSIGMNFSNPQDENKVLTASSTNLLSVWPSSFFITDWDTTLGAHGGDASIALPLIIGGIYDFSVDWGDGKSDIIKSWDDPVKVHQYGDHGIYKVVVKGKMYGFKMFGSSTPEKLVDIRQFGKLRLGKDGDFSAAINMKISASDPLDLSDKTDLNGMFSKCSSLTTAPSLKKWDTSKVTGMATMFEYATKFNEDISGWDVSKVTEMDYMFQFASSFNQPIGSWNVGKVTTMRAMFNGASSFSKNLEPWNVNASVNMSLMFHLSGLSSSPPSWYQPDGG